MKKNIYTFLIATLIVGMTLCFAQNNGGNGNHHGSRPDSLQVIELTGFVIVQTCDSTNYHDSLRVHSRYFLDTDNDGTEDYHLNFGPFWYEPDSSTAVRPEAGQEITISGGLVTKQRLNVQTVIVYEINGEFWRNPSFARWNNLGRHNYWKRRCQNRLRGGYGFGFNHDSLSVETLTGMILVDTTFHMNHFYLDIDQDAQPDYSLNFGPFWYKPESGAVRPNDGQTVTVLGGVFTNSNRIPMMIVYELDGLVWRDSSKVGKHFGGGWIQGSMSGSRTFNTPFDSEDQITIRSGWRGGHMGNMMQDNMFVQFLEVLPDNVPENVNNNVFAGYELHMYNSSGIDVMVSSDQMGGRKMRMNNRVSFQLHYTDSQMSYSGITENNIVAQYYDDDNNEWITVESSIDYENNIVTFESEEVGNYIVLSSDNSMTGIELMNEDLPSEFKLNQNYPNPFNPETKIEFAVASEGMTKLVVYNTLGQIVEVLVDENLPAGTYSARFKSKKLASGVYFYQLRHNDKVITKKMNLIK